MKRKSFIVGMFTAGCFIATTILMPSVGNAQADPNVAKSMADLKAATAKLGAPKLDGKEAVSGKDASALYFGTSKINNNYDIVDAVVKNQWRNRHAVRQDRRRIRSRFHQRAEG